MKKGKLVSLVEGDDRKENIFRALKLIEKDLSSFKKAKTALIKPNLTSAYNATANTASEAVEAVLEFFQTYDPDFSQKKIVIAESSGEAFNEGEKMKKVYQRFGFEKIFKKYANLAVGDLNKSKKFQKISIKTLSGEKKIRVAREVFDFDYKISLTVPKTHDTVGVTLGIKNFLVGVIKQEDKSLMHGLTEAHSVAAFIIQKAPWQFNWFFNNYLPSKLKDKFTGFDPQIYQKSVVCLHQNLFRLGKRIMPDLVVIDGWWGMEADGPVYGRRRNLRMAITSTDPIAADAVGARVMGFEPKKIAYLQLLAQAGKGQLSGRQLVGDKINSVSQKFTPHRHYRYQLKGIKILERGSDD